MRITVVGKGNLGGGLADLFRDNDEPLLATNVGALIQSEAKRMAQQSGARIHVVVEGEADKYAASSSRPAPASPRRPQPALSMILGHTDRGFRESLQRCR